MSAPSSNSSSSLKRSAEEAGLAKIGKLGNNDSRRRMHEEETESEEEGSPVGKNPDSRRDFSEAGIILKVDMENFMCHKKFVITLGKRVNFITGQNGSGSCFSSTSNEDLVHHAVVS